MLTILTPSKTMNFTTDVPGFARSSGAIFLDEAKHLRSIIAKYGISDLKALMNISDDLARKTHDMYLQTVQKQAFWTYDGDVFKGVQAKTLDKSDADFAQAHIVVPSAIYGLVRPYDLIAPYRLEMKAKLSVDDSKNLYEYWGDKLGKYTDQQANGEVLMLSSLEYARAIQSHVSEATRIVTPAFIDKKPNGDESQVAIYNKMMRGVMARWVIDNRIDSLESINAFTAHEYAYDVGRSTKQRPVFYRQDMKPLVF